VPACGRLGFETHDPAGTGDGGAADGGDGDGGGGEIDAGLTDLCEDPATLLVVTTDVDEDDAGEVAQPPHLGSGLSLREAIGIANQRAGRDCIRFDRPMTISIDPAALPALTDDAGTVIDGGGVVHVTGVPVAPQLATGIDVAAGPSAVLGLRVSNFATGINAGSADGVLGPGDNVHGCANGVRVAGAGTSIRALRSHDNSEHGIRIEAAITGTDVAQTILHHNGQDGIRANGPDVSVRHATIALNGTGIAGSGDAAISVVNSIFYQNTGAGVSVENEASIDFCDFFQDGCNNCFIGGSSITDDPQFTSVVDSDYSLAAGSPAIDKGSDTGLDVNGDAAGLFNDLAPDMGALESE